MVQQLFGALPGIIGKGAHRLQAEGDIVPCALGVVQGTLNQAV